MKTLTKMTEEEISEEAERCYSRALDHLVGVQASRIALGLDLINIEESHLYKALGFDSFSAFCSAPPFSGGLGLTPRSRQTTMQVSRRFILELKADVSEVVKISYSNLQTLVPVVSDENIEQVLHDALTLGNRDIRRNRDEGAYDGIQRGLDAEDEPEAEFKEHRVRCPYCLNRVILSAVGSGKEIQIGVAIEVEEDSN
jgi:hypothetical protein